MNPDKPRWTADQNREARVARRVEQLRAKYRRRD